VSPTIVSHVINETRFVSEKLRARILEAMRELNYQPSAVARTLRCGETHTIGLIFPDNANPFLAEVARGIEDTEQTRSARAVIRTGTAGSVGLVKNKHRTRTSSAPGASSFELST